MFDLFHPMLDAILIVSGISLVALLATSSRYWDWDDKDDED